MSVQFNTHKGLKRWQCNGMFLRINQHIFATFVYGLKLAFFSAIFFASTFLITGLLMAGQFHPGLTLVASSYAFMLCFATSVIAFLFSILFKKFTARSGIVFESYLWTGFSAFLANLLPLSLLWLEFTWYYLVILIPSLISVYLGARIYRQTWSRLTIILTDGTDQN